MPSIPRECDDPAASAVGSSSHAAAVSTQDWLDSLHRTKKSVALPASRSTDRMSASGVSLNPAGGAGPGPLRHGAGDFRAPVPPRSALAAGSEESFDAGSRSSLQSDKKRRVRFETQTSASAQSAPADRQRSRKQQQRPSADDERSRAAPDGDDESARGSSSSLFSKFRRVVADGVGALFGLSKPKTGTEDTPDARPATTCNGHLAAGSFEVR